MRITMDQKKLNIFLIYYGVLDSKNGSNTHILELFKQGEE